MRSWLLGLFFSLTCTAVVAQPFEVTVPAGLSDIPTESVMLRMADEVMRTYRDEDRQRYLNTLFRLQIISGKQVEAVKSIEELRVLRGAAPDQVPQFLQHEIYARAKEMQSQVGSDFGSAWRECFKRRFGVLEDRVALRAEYGFGAGLPRLRRELDAALGKVKGRRHVPLSDAIELLRAYQVHAAYAAFQPLFNAALKDDDARRYAVERDVLIRTPDGAGISTLVVRPMNAGPLPSLLSFTIYANDDESWGDAKAMAAHGYVGVVSYARGKGRSTDAIVPFVHDGADAAAVIEWIAKQPWSEGRVGMFGGSYNGFTQWAALKHRPPALKAIAASATVAPGIDVPMEGGIFLNFMYPWPFYTASNRVLDDVRYGDSPRWARLNHAWYASGRAYDDMPAVDGEPNPIFKEWLRHPDYDAYWQAMIPQNEAFKDIDIPVLTTTGYFDGGQIGVLHYLREHMRYRPDADHTLLIGPYEHFSMQTGVPLEVQGYKVDASARIDLQALRLSWFDHVFKGAPKPALLADRVNWQVMGADAWRHAPSLQAMATGTRRFHLHPGDSERHRLSEQHVKHVGITQRVDFADRGDVDWEPPASVVQVALDPRLGLVFDGPQLSEDLELAGSFSGVLEFIVNKKDVDLAISVFERTIDGRHVELAYWMQRASYALDRTRRQPLRHGVPQRIEVNGTRLLGAKLAPGSRIVLTLGVIKQPDRQLNSGSGKIPALETVQDAGEPMEIRWLDGSYIDFGVRDR